MTDEIKWYRHLVSMLALPFVVAVVVPASIVWLLADHDTRWNGLGFQNIMIVFRVMAFLIFSIGFALFIWTNWLFAAIGKGTLAPWDPTQKLVVHGPYRHVRNPMISGVLMILISQSVYVGSWLLAAWAFFFFLLNNLYFWKSEEPGLRKRFGESYNKYCRHVPRWLPRLLPWIPSSDKKY